ncbi:endonuclease [Paenibacillus ihbetae]|uniref:Endonuclease n=1 Tax=Paenibacillus ihbetae TaxID=1870820 RepID=A0A1B2E4T3_9BACL|nr:endonuclease/exonuclease/phosphatase family protein [Paenibacillus ihbetae]ANY74986.1 endonuclease [Paenibacillus ihbetae]
MNVITMTFNLRVNVDSDGSNAWPHRKHRAAAVIAEASPDLFGTQEGSGAMLRDLDEALPEYGRIGTGRMGQGDRDGEHCAIYYKQADFSILREGQFWLSETPEKPGSLGWDGSYPRICTWGLFQSTKDTGVRFYVVNTHFDHMGAVARQESAKLILDHIQRLTKEASLPVILMGDLNAGPGETEIEILREALQDAYELLGEPAGRTFHDFKGGLEGEPIDYIFTTRGVEMVETIIYRDTYDGAYPSDHYPVSMKWRAASE